MSMKLPVILSAIISLLLITPLVYMTADNQPPYEYNIELSYVIPNRTPVGRQLLVHWHFERINRICPGIITRYIVDQRTSARISYDPIPATKVIDSDDRYLDRTFFLPPGISPGLKWYYSEADYACNPLQRFYPLRVRTPRLSFEVTE